MVVKKASLLRVDQVEEFYNMYREGKLPYGVKHIRDYPIDFSKLIYQLKMLQKESGVSRYLYDMALNGYTDSEGNNIPYCSLLIWASMPDFPSWIDPLDTKVDIFSEYKRESRITLYKYNFNPKWIPLKNELLIRERKNKIDLILDK